MTAVGGSSRWSSLPESERARLWERTGGAVGSVAFSPGLFGALQRGSHARPTPYGGDASPCSVAGHRARRRPCQLSQRVEADKQRQAGHLHTAMHSRPEHGMSVVSTCAKLRIIAICATDCLPPAVGNLNGYLLQVRLHGGMEHRHSPSAPRQRRRPPPC